MVMLHEKILKRDDVQRDPHALVNVNIGYGLYLEADQQFTKAEEVLRKAEAIELKQDSPSKTALAGIYTLLADVLMDEYRTEEAVAKYKDLVENFQNVDSPKGKYKDHYAPFAVLKIGDYYAAHKQFDEGITYIRSVHEKYPGSRTAHAALAAIYDLQMAKGDKNSATATRQMLEKDAREHPEFAVTSMGTLTKWTVAKDGDKHHHQEK